MFETDVDRILQKSRLHEDAPFASHANEVLDRVDDRDVKDSVKGALESHSREGDQ